MRVTSPVVTIKDIWDALTAEYGVADSYGALVETNLDAKVSEAKANLTTLETRLSAARATALDELLAANLPTDIAAIIGYLDTEIAAILAAVDTEVAAILADVTGLAGAAMRGTDGVDTATMRGTDSALLAANYKQFTKGLTEHGTLIARAYGDIAAETYVNLLDVSGAGYLTGLWASFYEEFLSRMDIVIEIDGAEVAPFNHHASAHGNISKAGEAVCFKTTWDANWTRILMCTPMYRFDSSLKIKVYNTYNEPQGLGVRGNATYVTE